MKRQLQIVVVLVTLVLLGTGVAWAKKDKGGGPQIPPTVTAEQAKATVSAAIPRLTAGKPYTKQGKQGDLKLEVPVLLDQQIVTKVRLNPATGEILTQGQKSFVQKLSVTPEQAARTVQGVLREMQAGAPWLGKQGQWKVPLLYKGAVIAAVGVHGQNGSILPDWKAARDATMFGR